MFKAISLVKKVPSLSDEAFTSYWIDRFAPVAARLPGLRHYVVNVTSQESKTREWSGITELWFDSRAAYDAAFRASAINDQLDAMRPSFISEYAMYFVDETTIAIPSAESKNDG